MTTEVDPNKFIVATAGGGGGGGGSSGVPAGATGVSSGGTQQTQPGGASVTFKWAAPAPAVSTSAAAIDNGAAVLHGTVNPNDTSITDCHFEIAPGADVPCAQQVGGGSSPVAVSANAHGLKGGTAYRYRLVATSAGGTSAGGQVDFTTAPGGANPGLSLTGFKLTPSRFRAAPRKGTTFAFSVSQPSRVTITFERANKGGRYVKVPGKLSVKAAGGKRKLRFLGKVGGRRLTPGAYRISAVASASAHASPVRRAKATVLR
jgi:hypothetical protein